jgi:hypothetical protein
VTNVLTSKSSSFRARTFAAAARAAVVAASAHSLALCSRAARGLSCEKRLLFPALGVHDDSISGQLQIVFLIRCLSDPIAIGLRSCLILLGRVCSRSLPGVICFGARVADLAASTNPFILEPVINLMK